MTGRSVSQHCAPPPTVTSVKWNVDRALAVARSGNLRFIRDRLGGVVVVVALDSDHMVLQPTAEGYKLTRWRLITLLLPEKNSHMRGWIIRQLLLHQPATGFLLLIPSDKCYRTVHKTMPLPSSPRMLPSRRIWKTHCCRRVVSPAAHYVPMDE